MIAECSIVKNKRRKYMLGRCDENPSKIIGQYARTNHSLYNSYTLNFAINRI